MIPKILHFIWFGDIPPKSTYYAINMFKKVNSDFTINFIYEKDIENSINPDIVECKKLIYDKDSKYSIIFNSTQFHGTQHIDKKIFIVAFSDAFRAFILDKYGGIYLDCDTFPVRPFDEQLLKHKYFQCTVQRKNGEDYMYDWFFIGAEPGYGVYPGSMIKNYKNIHKPFPLHPDNLIKISDQRKQLQKKFDSCKIKYKECFDKKQYINHYFLKTNRWNKNIETTSKNEYTKYKRLQDASITKSALILTIFEDQNNYGQRLQAYALEKFISKFGIDAYTCSRRKTDNTNKSFNTFEQKHMHIWNIQHNRDIYVLNPNVLILGGDQVLNPNWSCLDKYGMDILNENFFNAISYSSSDGGESLQKKSKTQEKNLKYLKYLKAISVREQSTADFLKKTLNKNIRCDIDPVFLLSKDEWASIEEKPSCIENNEVFDFIYTISKNDNKKYDKDKIEILNGVKTYTCYGNTLNNKDALSPTEFIWMIRHCRNFTSQSFHGTCFAIIFEKLQKYVFNKNDLRIKNLCNKLGINIQNSDTTINYDAINRNIQNYVESAKQYFEDQFNLKDNVVADRRYCTGCMKCAEICPVQAIQIIKKNGFNYPKINTEKCINCGKCRNDCELNLKYEQNIKQLYFATSASTQDRWPSSSGGIVKTIARHVIQQNGVVYGVKYANDFKSCHFSRATDFDGVLDQCCSKYVESQPIPFKQIEKDLKDGINVLFTGLPCQVQAVHSMFSKYENLNTISLFCNSVPSQDGWRSYIQKLEKKYKSKVVFATARHNINNMYIVFLNGKVINEKIFENEWFKTFLKTNNQTRPSCFNCKFKYPFIPGDLIVGDTWGYNKKQYGFQDDKVGFILAMTDKGGQMIEKCGDDLTKCQLDISQMIEKMKKHQKALFEHR